MNNLRHGFVIENVETGKKLIIETFRQFTALKGMEKSIAREYINVLDTISIGILIARKQQAFELV